MSIFINQKQEVIQLELTPYGKHLFSLGKFSPTYYAFYDGDILYDGGYGGILESQNDIYNRIKNTPRLSVQTNYTSSVHASTAQPWLNTDSSNISPDEFEALSYSSMEYLRPIGTAERWSDFAPAWSVTTTSGSSGFTGKATYETLESIPTLTGSLTTNYLLTETPQGDDLPLREYRIIDQGSLRIDIQELHSALKSDGNFDIEVFRQPLNNQGEPDGQLQKLHFIDPMNTNAEALYAQEESEVFASTLNRTENIVSSDFPKLGNEYAEFFLSIRVDDEITDRGASSGVVEYSPGTGNAVDESCDPNTGGS